MGAGYPINFALTSAALKEHPLYVKYSNSTFANITETDVKTDLGNVLATYESAEVCAYLSWLLRTKLLLV